MPTKQPATAAAVRLDGALQEEVEAPTAAAPAKPPPGAGQRKPASRFVVRDLDLDDPEDVPDLSALSIKDPRDDVPKTTSSTTTRGGAATEGPVASRTRAREKERSAPAKPSASASVSASPTLSRYGVSLAYEAMPERDVLAHALHLTGFPPTALAGGGKEEEKDGDGKRQEQEGREALVRPWTEVGALISWLPEGHGAVATFCSVPTAQRAARKLPRAPHGIEATPLLSCPLAVQQRALAAGLVIPPRPKADTAASSRLILGALGMRSPSSTRPPIGGGGNGGGAGPSSSSSSSQSRRPPITRHQSTTKTPADGDNHGEGKGGSAPAAAAAAAGAAAAARGRGGRRRGGGGDA